MTRSPRLTTTRDSAETVGAAPVAPRAAGRRPRRFVSAAQILAVGLVCFGLWTLFDARQLYNSAKAAPLGTRRNAALAVLDPIARIDSALRLDKVVDAGNSLIGRTSLTPGAAASAPVVTATTVAPHRGRGHAHGVSGANAAGGPPPIPTPTAAAPLTVLDIGDSIGEDLGTGLADAIGTNPAVRLIQAALGNTGLADPAYYNWPAALEADLQQEHPGLVVVLLGGNDWQAFTDSDDVNVTPGTPQWATQYGARVGQMMAEATAAGAHVVWVGLPIMGPNAPFPADMAPTLNSVYRAEAAKYPGVVYMSSYQLFENADHQYAEYLDEDGNLVLVRDADGVHIAPPAGDDLIGDAVVKLVEHDFGVNLTGS